MNEQELVEVAFKVRDTVASWTKNNPEVDNNDLNGACAIASYALHKALSALGCPSQFVVRYRHPWGGHCWVEIGNIVIDITATQFEGPELACYDVGDEPEWFPSELLFPVYHDEDVFELTGDNGIDYTNGWGSQAAFTYEKEIADLVQKLIVEKG